MAYESSQAKAYNAGVTDGLRYGRSNGLGALRIRLMVAIAEGYTINGDLDYTRGVCDAALALAQERI